MAQVLETPEHVTIADGATATFNIPFTFEARAEIEVVVVAAATGLRTLQALDVDYSIPSADWAETGGDVVFLTGHLPADGDRVERRRVTPADQTEAFGDDATFRPVANESTFDRQTRMIQELRAQDYRSIKAPMGEAGLTLAPAASRAGLTRWDANGGLSSHAIGPGKFVAGDAEGLPVDASGTGNDPDLREDLASDTAGARLAAFRRRLDFGVVCNVSTKLAAYAIDATAEGFLIPDGTDQSEGLQALLAEVMRTGKEIHIDAGFDDYEDLERPGLRIDQTCTFFSDQWFDYQAAWAKGPVIRGIRDGAIIDTGIENGVVFDIGPLNPGYAGYKAVKAALFESLTFRRTGTQAGAGAFRARALTQSAIRNIGSYNLSGPQVKAMCEYGDRDACTLLTLEDVWSQNSSSWSWDLAATAPNNETSFIQMIRYMAQNSGTAEDLPITSITAANPPVVTVSGSRALPANGSHWYIFGGSMTQIDSRIAGAYKVANVNEGARTFELQTLAGANVNASAYTAYTSGGYACPRNPGSGGLKWKGQGLHLGGGGFAICKNQSIHIPGESGLAQDLTTSGLNVIENPQMLGAGIGGLRSADFGVFHLYANSVQAGAPTFCHLLFDGGTHSIVNIKLPALMYRATSAETDYVGVVFVGANVKHNTIEMGVPDFKQFGYPGQKVATGYRWPTPPTQADALLVGATTGRVWPGRLGNIIPLALEGPWGGGTTAVSDGPIIPWVVSSSGISQAATWLDGGVMVNIPADTRVYGYLYDAQATLERPAIEWSSTAPERHVELGYDVKPGTRRRYIMSAKTGGTAGEFLLTGIGWLNPHYHPATGYRWADVNGDERRKATAPTSDTDGTVVGEQTAGA